MQYCKLYVIYIPEESSLATASPCEVGRSQMVTLAPSRMNLAAVARPRPDAPPVTRPTTFFSMALFKCTLLFFVGLL